METVAWLAWLHFCGKRVQMNPWRWFHSGQIVGGARGREERLAWGRGCIRHHSNV